jgi:hypothetical protein
MGLDFIDLPFTLQLPTSVSQMAEMFHNYLTYITLIK